MNNDDLLWSVMATLVVWHNAWLWLLAMISPFCIGRFVANRKIRQEERLARKAKEAIEKQQQLADIRSRSSCFVQELKAELESFGFNNIKYGVRRIKDDDYVSSSGMYSWYMTKGNKIWKVTASATRAYSIEKV